MARWLRFVILAVWGALGGLWVFTTLVMWQVNPTDDVDRGRSGQLFWRSFVLWLVIGGALLTWRRRRARHDR